jgi:uncharacterized protein YxjI
VDDAFQARQRFSRRADQMDDLHWFVRGFYTKRVAGVQKLSEVGDMLTVIRSVLQFSVRRAETFSVRKKMVVIKFEKSFVDPGGFWLSYQTLCTQDEANAFYL